VDELKRHNRVCSASLLARNHNPSPICLDQRIADMPSLNSTNGCVEMVSKALVLPKYLTFIDPEEPGTALDEHAIMYRGRDRRYPRKLRGDQKLRDIH